MPSSATDVVAHREWLTSLVQLPASGKLVDLGCGGGEDLIAIADRSPSADVQFLGVDRAEKAVAAAKERNVRTNVSFQIADLTAGFPWSDDAFDVVFSHNYLECVIEVSAFVNEVARVLRRGGQVVFAHWDWDTQVYNDRDKDRVRRLVHAFADWQQAWMDHSDGWMGRRLWGVFESSGLFHGSVHARALLNTEYAEPFYGYARAQDFRSLVKRGLATADDVNGFLAEQEALAAEGRYCYSITGYVYVGRSRAT